MQHVGVSDSAHAALNPYAEAVHHVAIWATTTTIGGITLGTCLVIYMLRKRWK